MTIHSIKTKCLPLARIINKATYSSNDQTASWVGHGRLDRKTLAEVKSFAGNVRDVYYDGYGRYIFDLEGYEFDLLVNRTHVSLIVTRSV